ncbi:MAG: hypothetical protein ACRC8A_01415 [Microcoleaceae cyanobacterium]
MNQVALTAIGFWGCFNILGTVVAQFRPDRPTFFEEGERQFEQEVDRLNRQSSDPQPVLTIDDDLNGEQLLQLSEDVAISTVQLQWQKRENAAFEIPLGTIELQILATIDPDQPLFRLGIAYSRPLTPEQIRDPQVLLDQVRDAFQANVGLEQVSDRPITLENNPGLALSFAGASQRLECRLYLVNRRIYILAVDQLGTEEQTRQVTEDFFNSLRLLSPEQKL